MRVFDQPADTREGGWGGGEGRKGRNEKKQEDIETTGRNHFHRLETPVGAAVQ